MKENKTIHVIGTVTLVTLFAKLLGIVRESLQARAFGTQIAADLYTTANNNTIYLFTTAAYALCIAAVPILTPRLRRDRKEGYDTASNLITISVVLSAIAAAVWVGATFVPALADRLWEGGGQEAAQLAGYMRIMILTLPVIVLTYLLVALFQSLEHFVLQGSMSIPYNLALIAFLAVFAGRLGVGGYVIAVALAWLLQLGMTAPYALKEHYRYHPILDLRADYVRTFLKTAVVTVLTTSIFLFCYLQDSAMTAQLAGSPVSAFYYADKLFTPLTTTLVYSISTVLFPQFSEKFTQQDRPAYLRYIWNMLRGTLLLILPMSAVLAAFGTPIVKVLFEGGSFDAASTAATGSIFTIYALSMAGFCALDLLSKAYYTMEQTLTPLLVNGGVLLCNWGLNRLLGPRWGGAGLAAATAASITLGGAVMAALLLRGTSGVKLMPLLKSGAAALLMGGGLWFVTGLVLNGLEGKAVLVAKCVGLGAAAAAVYAALLAVTRQEDFRELLAKYRGPKEQ
ncbi:MAG: polysaccharide biosynthesis C-terminal domain-containing protein [Oscillospiraceae bacterium]|nr:polysaccharide biosynthesis C-terminal domain-containing protein [Oscillospiraceae bacterium]